MLTMSLGMTLGLIAYGMSRSVEAIVIARSNWLESYYETHPAVGFAFYVLYNWVLLVMASLPVLLCVPEAAGSGIPEVHSRGTAPGTLSRFSRVVPCCRPVDNNPLAPHGA